MGELANKRPADLVPARGRAEILEMDSPRELYRELERLSKRGELAEAGMARQAGEAWRVRIVRIPARRRARWPRWLAVVAGAALILGALLWLLAKLLTALAAALSALLPVALAFLGVVALILLLGGGRSTIDVVQRVTIKR